MGDKELEAVNWENMGYGTGRAEIMQKTVAPLERFFASHTRAELTQGSLDRRVLLFPVATPVDLLDHPQLKARGLLQGA